MRENLRLAVSACTNNIIMGDGVNYQLCRCSYRVAGGIGTAIGICNG